MSSKTRIKTIKNSWKVLVYHDFIEDEREVVYETNHYWKAWLYYTFMAPGGLYWSSRILK